MTEFMSMPGQESSNVPAIQLPLDKYDPRPSSNETAIVPTTQTSDGESFSPSSFDVLLRPEDWATNALSQFERRGRNKNWIFE